MKEMLQEYLWIVIIVVAVLIILYILYLIASNRRFHKMVDPHIAALKEYEERRHRMVHDIPQGVNGAYAEAVQQAEAQAQKPIPADYTWQEQDKRR